MDESRWYRQGQIDGAMLYAPDARVFTSARAVRAMTAAEEAEYKAGYKAGIRNVSADRRAALGYDD